MNIWNLKPGERVTLWSAPDYSARQERAERAKERATWKRVEVRLPPDTFARVQALTERPEGWARPSREEVLRSVIWSGAGVLERVDAAADRRRAKRHARKGGAA